MSQPTNNMRTLIEERIKQLPGPQGSADNGAYMRNLVNKCDAVAMFNGDGSLMWAWSQDQMNAWYWHVDIENEADYMYSKESYDFVQKDNSHVKVVSETENVRSFIGSQSGSKSVSQEQTSCLFFNGTKFHLTQKDEAENGIIFIILGGPDGRGLHAAISPTRDCMVVAAAASKPRTTEAWMGIENTRPAGNITVTSLAIAGEFRAHAPGALGI